MADMWAKIFPTRLRAYGVGLGATSQWLFNFVITEITPKAINNIGWRTFIMFAVFCVAMGVFVLLLAKETKGRSLEEMDVLFGAVDQDERKAAVEQVLHKNEVAHREDVDEEVTAAVATAPADDGDDKRSKA